MRLLSDATIWVIVLLSICAASFSACVQGNSTTVFATPPPVFGVAPSVAHFCPTPSDLQPIIQITVSPNSQTFSSNNVTICGYDSPHGDGCLFQVSAYGDQQTAMSQYISMQQQFQQVGEGIQLISGLGDAAYFVQGEGIYSRKGAFTISNKCLFLPPRPVDDENIDKQIATLLLSRI